MKTLWLTLIVLGLAVASCQNRVPGSRAAVISSDAFEDGAIDGSLWVVGGGARGTWRDSPIGSGHWQYSNEEVVADDGYLQARVWGPASGNTYGAEAWVRTSTNFNDGKNHVIDFAWEPVFADSHHNAYYIQITDGFSPAVGDLHWPQRRPPLSPITESDLSGTSDLLWCTLGGEPSRGLFFQNQASIGRVKWSITIAPEGIARLHDGPSGHGSVLHEATLDSSKPWYIRFMISDGTSAGFPSGDAQLRLYYFSARSTPSR